MFRSCQKRTHLGNASHDLAPQDDGVLLHEDKLRQDLEDAREDRVLRRLRPLLRLNVAHVRSELEPGMGSGKADENYKIATPKEAESLECCLESTHLCW